MLREPLTHFFAAGLVIFLGVGAWRGNQRPVVRITAADLNQLVGYWQMQSQRPPTPDEMKAMVRDRIDEEILASEARGLGLDKDDLIIRRRLAQKMLFSREAGTTAAPDDATLKAYYERTRDRYAVAARVSVRHVYFSANRAGPDARAAAAEALQRARAGHDVSGDPFMLSTSYGDVALNDLAKDYGPEFAAAVRQAPLSQWSGPVQSAYGWHIIRVDMRTVAGVAPFDQVKSDVRDAFLAEQRETDNAAYLDGLRRRYRVDVEDTSVPTPPSTAAGTKSRPAIQ